MNCLATLPSSFTCEERLVIRISLTGSGPLTTFHLISSLILEKFRMQLSVKLLKSRFKQRAASSSNKTGAINRVKFETVFRIFYFTRPTHEARYKVSPDNTMAHNDQKWKGTSF